jgi:hypothetical protein
MDPVAAASVAVKAPRWKRTLTMGCAATKRATEAGSVRRRAASSARFSLSSAAARSSALILRLRSGRSATLMAMPIMPSGSWKSRSA